MTPSKDFASAAMLRLIHLGLRQQGLVIESKLPTQKAPQGARVPLSDKRALAHQLHQAFGGTALLRMGQAIHSAPDEPALVALSMARHPFDLITRWQRLERFVHSRHRVEIDLSGAHSVQLHHCSLDSAQATTPGEDLLIFGLLVALLNRIGAAGLRARFLGEPIWRFNRGAWRDSKTLVDTSHWQVQWQAQATIHARHSVHQAATRGDAAYQIKAAAAQLLQTDPGRAWTVAALAEELTTSSRDLQRQLQAQQSSFSALLSQAHLTQAAKSLVTTRQSASEIGYACGYADQAHFNREFKRHTAFTPLAYRQHFAA
jgi:AraC-like DNA-binding protein